MSNIAIVGVEQSGKTALMVSWGWHCQHPDRNGYYLLPDPKGGQTTLDYVCEQMNGMRGGAWPIATTPDEVRRLDWILGRKGRTIGELSFLDYGGELYRKAFNDGPSATLALKDGRSLWDKLMGTPEHTDTTVEKLQRHVKSCSSLVILVNLADVINDPHMTNLRTRQMMSVVKCMLDIMWKRERGWFNVAIVFSQADLYADTLSKAGSLRCAYKTYLPLIAAHYPNVRLFAVSAVNKTIPDAYGLPIPAPDFCAEGLEKLTAWVAMSDDGWKIDVGFWMGLVYVIIPLCWPFLIFRVLPRKFRFWKARGLRIKRKSR